MAAACHISTGTSFGSGTLVDGMPFGLPRLCVLTNKHVLKSPEVALQSKLTFKFEERFKPCDYVKLQLRPDLGFFNHKDRDIDYALCACEQEGDGVARLKCKPISISRESVAAPVEGQPVTIVQHPDGGFKVTSSWTVKDVTARGLTYLTDTKGGSSGSLVLNHTYDPVGLHFAGSADENYGCRMDAVLTHLEGQLKVKNARALADSDDRAEGVLGSVYSAACEGPVTLCAPKLQSMCLMWYRR